MPGGNAEGDAPTRSRPPRPTTTTRWILFAILLASVVLRLGAVLHTESTNPRHHLWPDSLSYLDPARSLVDDHRYDTAPGSRTPEADRLPGYPVFLASVFTVFGDDVMPVLLIQVALGALTVFLAFRIGNRVWGPTVGLVAAAIVGLDPYQIRMADWIMPEALCTLALLLVVACGYRLFEQDAPPRVRDAVGLGLAITLATLLRPTTYYLPTVAAGFLLVGLRRFSAKQVLATVAALLVPIVIVFGAWQWRNHEDLGTWRYSSLDGASAYYYRAAGTIAQRDGIKRQQATRILRKQIEGLDRLPAFHPVMWRTPAGYRVGAWRDRLFSKGVDIVVSNPVPAAIMTARSFAWELADRGFLLSSMDLDRFLSLSSIPLAGVMFAAALLAFYALTAYGVVVALRSRDRLKAHLFALTVAFYVLFASAGPEGSARFRSTIMPILSLFAALAVVTIVRQVAARRHGERPATSSPVLEPPRPGVA